MSTYLGNNVDILSFVDILSASPILPSGVNFRRRTYLNRSFYRISAAKTFCWVPLKTPKSDLLWSVQSAFPEQNRALWHSSAAQLIRDTPRRADLPWPWASNLAEDKRTKEALEWIFSLSAMTGDNFGFRERDKALEWSQFLTS